MKQGQPVHWQNSEDLHHSATATARAGDIAAAGIREGVKYYFVDFVRKGGTPSPPFTDFFPSKKGVTDLGGTPLPTFTDFFLSEKGVTDLWTKSPKKYLKCSLREGIQTKKTFLNGHCLSRGGGG